MCHEIIDMTGEADQSRRMGERNASSVDAVVLHQMGFDRGSKAAPYLRVKAHFIVLQNGIIAQLHRFKDYLHSSNELNSRSVAMEFAGNFPSDRGRWWHPSGTTANARHDREHHMSPTQVSAGLYLVKYLAMNHGIRFVFAHRQAGTHHNCPGPEIWFNIGEPARRMGLSDGGYNYKLGDGRPIPDSWRNHNYMVITEEEAERFQP